MNFSKKSFDTSRMEVLKEMINLIRRVIQPCKKCPYKLGLLETTMNPCPQCKLNNYQAYDEFKKQMLKNGTIGRK